MSDQSVVTAMTQAVELAQNSAVAAIASTKDLAMVKALTADLNKKDSALYYADKATKTAPNWACALTTLALIQKAISQNNPGKTNGNKPAKKNINSIFLTPNII